MYYCNEIKKLSVLSLYEGELLGVVDKLYFDKKLKKLVEIEIINEDGAKLILPTKNIYHLGKNAITIKNNLALNIKIVQSELLVCPIFSKAYTISGEYLGIIKEISLNEKFLTTNICLDNEKTLDINKLASCGKNAVIFNENLPINMKKFTPQKQPKSFKSNAVKTTQILPEKPQNKTNNVSEIKVKQTTESAEFLIGRICKKDIYNFNNELLVKANTVITKKNIKEVNIYGKLRELMLYSTIS